MHPEAPDFRLDARSLDLSSCARKCRLLRPIPYKLSPEFTLARLHREMMMTSHSFSAKKSGESSGLVGRRPASFGSSGETANDRAAFGSRGSDGLGFDNDSCELKSDWLNGHRVRNVAFEQGVIGGGLEQLQNRELAGLGQTGCVEQFMEGENANAMHKSACPVDKSTYPTQGVGPALEGTYRDLLVRRMERENVQSRNGAPEARLRARQPMRERRGRQTGGDATPGHGSLWSMFRPDFEGMVQRLVPAVHAKEREQDMESQVEKAMSLAEGGAGGLDPTEEGPEEEAVDDTVRRLIEEETGWDRMRELWSKHEGVYRQDMSPELAQAFKSASTVGFMVFFVAGIRSVRFHKEEFIKNHQHVKWASKFKATRTYQDKIIVESVKTGARWAWRCALFTGVWMLTATHISVYRNKSGIVEHVAAGSVAGALSAINMGLRAMAARTVIGATFGLGAGLLFLPVLRSFGDTQEERHYWKVVNRVQAKNEAQRFSDEALTYDPLYKPEWKRAVEEGGTVELPGTKDKEMSTTPFVAKTKA